MKVISFLSQLKTGLPPHGFKRNIPVHGNGIIFVEVKIELLYLPCAILRSQLRKILRIIRTRNAVLHHVRAKLMRAMAILAVDVMRDQIGRAHV